MKCSHFASFSTQNKSDFIFKNQNTVKTPNELIFSKFLKIFVGTDWWTVGLKYFPLPKFHMLSFTGHAKACASVTSQLLFVPELTALSSCGFCQDIWDLHIQIHPWCKFEWKGEKEKIWSLWYPGVCWVRLLFQPGWWGWNVKQHPHSQGLFWEKPEVSVCVPNLHLWHHLAPCLKRKAI